MGGDYEDRIDTKKDPVSGPGEEVLIQGLRFHKNRGEVHFHDDGANLKVAMPVHAWWAAWQDLRCPSGAGDQGKHFEFQDFTNNARLIAHSELQGDAVRLTTFQVVPFAPPTTYDRIWHALEMFTNKSGRSQ